MQGGLIRCATGWETHLQSVSLDKGKWFCVPGEASGFGIRRLCGHSYHRRACRTTCSWGIPTVVYYLFLFGYWLVLLPLYMSAKWSLREAAIFLGFSLLFWSFQDTLYYLILGYPALAPFPDRPGFYPLLVNWYPVWFFILSRIIAGFCVILYVGLHPDWGEEPLVWPSLGKEEARWILRVFVILIVGILIFGAWYHQYSRGGFGGKVLYEVDFKYKRESFPETVFSGLLEKFFDSSCGSNRYILVRHMNLSNLRIAWIKESKILDSHLGRDVEILGKLIPISGMSEGVYYSKKELLPGRIREAMPLA